MHGTASRLWPAPLGSAEEGEFRAGRKKAVHISALGNLLPRVPSLGEERGPWERDFYHFDEMVLTTGACNFQHGGRVDPRNVR